MSEWCRNCYAERLIATRLSKHPVYRGLAIMKDSGPQFVNAEHGRDLFVRVTLVEQVAEVVMAAAPRHTFQVLTKRTRRMAGWFAWIQNQGDEHRPTDPDLPPLGCRETWLPEPPAEMSVWATDEEVTRES